MTRLSSSDFQRLIQEVQKAAEDLYQELTAPREEPTENTLPVQSRTDTGNGGKRSEKVACLWSSKVNLLRVSGTGITAGEKRSHRSSLMGRSSETKPI
jgi:hypothetical protein